MADTTGEVLTEQQKKWFASVQAGLVRDTGRSLEEWAAIARACPENITRKQIDWLRDKQGLGVNRGAIVLNAAFPDRMNWHDTDAARDALWKDPGSREIFEAVAAKVAGFEGLVTGQRKTFGTWSRKAQFAAIKPTNGGGAVLGLALTPEVNSRLQVASGKDGWSDRLKSRLPLSRAAEVDDDVDPCSTKLFRRPSQQPPPMEQSRLFRVRPV